LLGQLLGTLLFDHLLPRQFLGSLLFGQSLRRRLLARKLFGTLLLGKALRFLIRTPLRQHTCGFGFGAGPCGFLVFRLPGQLRRGIGLLFSRFRYFRQGRQFGRRQYEAGILAHLPGDHLGVQRFLWRLGSRAGTPPQDTARWRRRLGRRWRRNGRHRIAQGKAAARHRRRRRRCGLGRRSYGR
jgi:hypothetical protein